MFRIGLNFIADPHKRMRVAVVLFFASIAGWPISALTFASDEPQTVLGLSWLAITITALDVMINTYALLKLEEGDSGK